MSIPWYYTNATIEVTSFCNLDCKHCLLPREYRKRRVFLDPEKAIEVIDTLWKSGAFSITITGGEPTLYPHDDLIKILAEARRRGLEVMMNTNATGFSDELARAVSRMGINIKVSLYGADRETYIKFSGNDVFLSVDKSLNLLKKYGAWMSIDIKYTKFHAEIGKKPTDLIEYARKFSEIVRIDTHFLRGWWGRGYEPAKQSLDRQEVIKEETEEEAKVSEIYSHHPYIRHLPGPTDPCAAIYSPGVYVSANGDILMCPFNDELVTSVYNKNWDGIYQKKVISFRTLPWKAGRCNYKMYIFKE